MQSIDQITDILKGSGLISFSVDGQGFALQGLNDKIGNDTTIIGMHARTKGIENPRDTDVDLVLILVGIHHGFGDTFALVITRTRTNGINISPIAFVLGMDLRVAVDFGSGGEQNARANAFGQAQHVECAHGTGFDGLDGVKLVMGRRSGASKVIDLIDFQSNSLGNVMDMETDGQIK